MNTPKIGDLIVHTDSVSGEDRVGTVSSLLSAQFIYQEQLSAHVTRTRFAFYNDDWSDYDPTPEY